jgi:hypothetical protein
MLWSVDTLCEVGDGDAPVMDNGTAGTDDADVFIGVMGKAASSKRGRKKPLFAVSVDGVATNVELRAKRLDGIHMELG